ncbi:hypothetical protein BDZ97DRAFT_1178507 [Flammula alnicola]|nr:hypothetical protein BDZ97DRAFT_1178507 [Flammula alnicola]
MEESKAINPELFDSEAAEYIDTLYACTYSHDTSIFFLDILKLSTYVLRSPFDDIEFTLTPPNLQTVDDLRLFNSKAPVSILDDDILSRIFMFNASLDFECTHRPSQTARRTSQVFHKWRQVALGFPMIWAASLDFGDPLPWIEEVISRTGSVPLNVVVPSITIPNPESLWFGDAENGSLLNMLDDISEGIDIADDIFNLALPLINRARILAIKTDKSQWESLAPALTQPHPNLQSFSLVREVYHTFQDLALPENLFAGPAPQLRTFHLQGFICQPEYLSLQNLTSLYVVGTFVRDRALQGLTAVAWLRALEGMPKLKNLQLVYCVWETTGETLAPLPTEDVSLPQLESVRLRALQRDPRLPQSSFRLQYRYQLPRHHCLRPLPLTDADSCPNAEIFGGNVQGRIHFIVDLFYSSLIA